MHYIPQHSTEMSYRPVLLVSLSPLIRAGTRGWTRHRAHLRYGFKWKIRTMLDIDPRYSTCNLHKTSGGNKLVLLNTEYMQRQCIIGSDKYTHIYIWSLNKCSLWVNMIIQDDQPDHNSKYKQLCFLSLKLGNQVPGKGFKISTQFHRKQHRGNEKICHTQSSSAVLTQKKIHNTVESRSIVSTSIVFPHVLFAIFGPELSSI